MTKGFSWPWVASVLDRVDPVVKIGFHELKLFDRLPATVRGTGRTGSAKNLYGSSNYEILRRPPSAELLRMTPINAVSGWALVGYRVLSENILYYKGSTVSGLCYLTG